MNGVPVPTLREYDFSDEKLRDSVGIRPLEISGLNRPKVGELQDGQNSFTDRRL